MHNLINVSFIGSTSITAEFGLKLLLKHPYVKIKYLISESQTGRNLSDIFPEFGNLIDIELQNYDYKKIIGESDVIFIFKQHGKSIEKTKELILEIKKSKKKIKIIDMSADFRLKNKEHYKKYYDIEHPFPEYLETAIYGLPEINKEKIINSDFIANPGCYPTSIILAMAPLMINKYIKDENIIIESYSGISGAGRIPNEKNNAINIMENIYTYKFNDHQHIPEIKQELENLSKTKLEFSFVPHIVPLKYGILTTIYCDLIKKSSFDQINILYKKFYKDKSFIRILKPNQYPEIKNVTGTNFCDISIQVISEKKIAIMSSIDNIIKGASGQAIQNMNLMFGMKETEGLMNLI